VNPVEDDMKHPAWLWSAGLALGLLTQAIDPVFANNANNALPDAIEQQGRRLTLNASGTGVKALVVQVYLVGLYGSQKVGQHQALLQDGGARRLTLKMLRDVSESDFKSGLQYTLEATPALTRFSQQVRAIVDSLPLDQGRLKHGDTLTIDWQPEQGLRIAFNQRPCFGPIRQAELFQALLRLWLDEDPRRSVLQLERPTDTALDTPSRLSAWKALP